MISRDSKFKLNSLSHDAITYVARNNFNVCTPIMSIFLHNCFFLYTEYFDVGISSEMNLKITQTVYMSYKHLYYLTLFLSYRRVSLILITN